MTKKTSEPVTEDDDKADPEEVFADNYMNDIMKRLGCKDDEAFKKFVVKQSRMVTSFIALLDVTSNTQVVFIVLFELLKHKIISKNQFLKALKRFKLTRNEILKRNGFEDIPDDVDVIIKSQSEVKETKEEYDKSYKGYA